VIDLAEEPYDGPAGTLLVEELRAEINVRYAADVATMTPEEAALDDAAYLAEVTADLVRRPHGCFVVARLDGELVGCGAVKRYHPVDGSEPVDGVGEIKRMYTVPAARRRGVSSAILARLEDLAVELGYHRLVLETGTEQPEAMALYEARGWALVPPYGHYRDSEFSRCYAKDLVPS
jgi:GNAT superfamily N-acetyltransferase